MRKLMLVVCSVLIANGAFCQTVYDPKYVKSNMTHDSYFSEENGYHTLDRIDINNSETILYFTFTKTGNLWFNMHKSAILKTNTGQVVKLIRCEGMRVLGDLYESDPEKSKIYWKAIFPRIDANATVIDLDENISSGDGYFIWGIQLSNIATNSNNTSENNEIQKQSTSTNQVIPNVPVPDNNKSNSTNNEAPVPQNIVSDVDLNIPFEAKPNSNRFALIIGNEDYHSNQSGLRAEADVEFAAHDATTFKEYAIKILGVPEDNIIFITNANLVEMNRSVEKLSLLSKTTGGQGEIFFYYAGHGFPDEKTKEAYIIPVDVSGSDLKYALKLKDIYISLTAYQSKRVTIFLDACFSGGAREEGLLASRGVKIKPKETMLFGNEVVFCATSNDQSALAYKTKGHGMFTYFLLKKLQETKGDITYGDLYESLQKQVGVKSILENSKEQTPTVVVSPTVGETWKSWRMK